MNNSSFLDTKIRTPLETMRDLMDKVERLARHYAESTEDIVTHGYLHELIDALPYDALASAESADAHHKEEQETREYFADSKAMYRHPGV